MYSGTSPYRSYKGVPPAPPALGQGEGLQVKSVMQGKKYCLDLFIYQNNAELKIHLCLILKTQDFFRLFLETLCECPVYLVTHMIN